MDDYFWCHTCSHEVEVFQISPDKLICSQCSSEDVQLVDGDNEDDD